MKYSKNNPYINMNSKYFITKDRKNDDDSFDKVNANYISNLYDSSQTYNSKINQDKIRLNNLGFSNLNNFRKINNIYENNYTSKHYNTNSKYDFSRNENLKSENNRGNNTLNKMDYFQNKRQTQNLFNTNFIYNNTLNFTNYKIPNNIINKKELFAERSQNKDYKNRVDNISSLNNIISINDLNINRQNKQKNIKDDKYIKINNIEKENENIKSKNHYHKMNNNNKSMDSKRAINKSINSLGNHIININKGKIINLSNLNGGFSYATDKYSCFYQNKREVALKSKNEKNSNTKTEINLSKYYKKVKTKNDNDKEKNKIPNSIPTPVQNNPNPKKVSTNNSTYFSHKLKKENNKYPLRINFTCENLNNALENESLIENKNKKEIYKEKIKEKEKSKEKLREKEDQKDKEKYIEKIKEKEKEKLIVKIKEKVKPIETPKANQTDYSSIRHAKNMTKIHLCNSFNDNNKFNKMIKPNYNTERISTNNINKNREIVNESEKEYENGNKRNTYVINIINKDDKQENKKNMVSIGVGNNTEKKEIKISNNNKRKPELSFNYERLNYKQPQNNNKNGHILRIKNNERLTISNNHNKLNSSNLNNEKKEEKKRIYKISSNVVNEQYYKQKFQETEVNSDDENSYLTISMQSLNDSKIMEIANRYITEDEELDKNEINDILNSKKPRLIQI